ncbi:MAG: hypothetical protein APF81_02700 [Desulfosporosinus sp. BRH_c37]|nr:MAG: hypothetical protein APF81_02700 [Desulfosporosinus sp. BRH_c37]
MSFVKLIKNPKFILILTIVFLCFSINAFINSLDKALNKPGGKTHTEIMLWKSPGYPEDPHLNFFEFQIYPNPENIRVIYKIQNRSYKPAMIESLVDIGVVRADENNIGDPGSLIWRWSQNHSESGLIKTDLAPGETYRREIVIDRKEIDIQSQYYINAYYNGQLVSQYKIIEGLYDK